MYRYRIRVIERLSGRVSLPALFPTCPAAKFSKLWPTRGLLLNHEKLLKALNEDLQACREASRFESSQEHKQRNTVEFSALTTHLMWAESVGDNQTELERIVHSLEANPFLRRYQRWRSRSS
jgi:hypothetical protein